jgi:hypothetical protein
MPASRSKISTILSPDPGEMAERYGAETTVIDWHARLACSDCGSRQVDFVVTGTERRLEAGSK